jgi:cysteine synthase A
MPNLSVICIVVGGLLSTSVLYKALSHLYRRRRRQPAKPRSCSELADLVGNTPLVLIPSLSRASRCKIFAKCEHMNPCGSSKDRVAKNFLLCALRSGRLKPGGLVVEGTSGSTGISLARLCCSLGLRCLVVMPDDQAEEKRELLRLFNADVELVRPCSIVHPQHYVNVARQRAAELGGVFMDQFESELNDAAHFASTGPEIWEQTHGAIDAFVASAGTGGLISGVGRFLKHASGLRCKVFLADPTGSSLTHLVKDGVCFAPEQAEARARLHRVDSLTEGVGCDRITANFARALPVLDDALRVRDDEVARMARHLLLHDGFFVGSSSALNAAAAFRVAQALGPGHVVVTVFCSAGERERSKLFSDEYCRTAWGLRDLAAHSAQWHA